jgi:hypothetical protein
MAEEAVIRDVYSIISKAKREVKVKAQISRVARFPDIGLLLIVTLGFKMVFRKEKPQDLKGSR